LLIGIISDLHANIFGLKSVLCGLKDTELILCAGDITGYYTFINEVFDELETCNVRFIRGNHDNYLLEDSLSVKNGIKRQSIAYTKTHIAPANLKKLKQAKNTFHTTIDGVTIKMYHGSPWNVSEGYIYPDYPFFERFLETKADIVILGHTHYPMIKRTNEVTIINPGSCGQPRDYDPRASCAVLDLETRNVEIKRFSYDAHKVREEVIAHNFDRSLIDILSRTKKTGHTHQ